VGCLQIATPCFVASTGYNSATRIHTITTLFAAWRALSTPLGRSAQRLRVGMIMETFGILDEGRKWWGEHLGDL
jgi:hypothetical protein